MPTKLSLEINHLLEIMESAQGEYVAMGLKTLLFFGLIAFVYLRLRKQLTKDLTKAIKPLTLKESAATQQSGALQKPKKYIPKHREQAILKSIGNFELGHGFLNKDISLNVLAAQFGVNHRYLSFVVNKHKKMDFASYINELRIGYIIDRLESDSKYLHYKISYLAQQCGFASHSRFTVAFKKSTGHSPSYFIGNLKKIKTNELTLEKRGMV